MNTFQDLVLALHRFWRAQGCALMEPYDLEKGAGTFNPATFFGVLGPRPWRVAYVEPSRRPADGRYGENPIRFGLHHQYQVILKPPPPDIQDLYLRSLEAVGLDLKEHDVKFSHDDWESPTLGAWGVGWQVWLDGMEITQFTYFQQMGGVDLDPVSVELTYGLERIALFLQGQESAFDLKWAEWLTYGELFRERERQFSVYHFARANVERARQMFDFHEAEAKECLSLGLVYPAYDHTLRCSHLFNTLDARGALATAERETYIARVRALARACAETYLAEVVGARASPRDRV
ncbi:MAG: glycine--tRNA ligase subunit alpha [Candidatus Bipolaricaulota bacterium]|nr:glycine--tRNA ligase subunit alpha [Candidatus Bipolaricaulota bacterium]MCX7844138.1 glycine--tRNA ligase subunit alpha [Candidatus Bipolaricaulota bacterium]MDW8152273.1 glycine--tRNA ligase subunit alpha [Candidatus Bipolaricaulota bacterium]